MSEELSSTEREELEALRREKAMREKGGLRLQVSQKGAVSLYGLGRFPVTLYKEQWDKVLDYADAIKNFMKEPEGSLKIKPKFLPLQNDKQSIDMNLTL